MTLHLPATIGGPADASMWLNDSSDDYLIRSNIDPDIKSNIVSRSRECSGRFWVGAGIRILEVRLKCIREPISDNN